MRLCLLVLSSALIAPCLPAQTLPAELRARSIQLLESSSLSDKAWGAHLIASLHLTDLQDRLISELRACQDLRDAAIDGPEYAYVQKLLDALIQMDAWVPADLVMPFRRGHRAEVMILLLCNGRSEPVLLDLFKEDLVDTEWMAVANSLLERRSNRLLERMLDGMPVTHQFEVVDHQLPFGLAGGHGDGLPEPPPKRHMPSGFPPTGLYRLTSYVGNGATILASGPVNILYNRHVVPTSGFVPWPSHGRDMIKTPRTEFRLEILAAATHLPLSLVKETFRPTTRIPWRTADHLSKEVSRKLDEQSAGIYNLIVGAKLRGETDMKSIRIEINPELRDHREQRSGQLVVPRPRIINVDLN
jgi:hypothetical protein